MAATALNDERRIVPRWRTSWATARLGELAALRPSSSPVEQDAERLADLLSAKVSEWLANRALPFAADLITTAFVSGDLSRAEDAAHFILSQGSTVSSSLRLLASSILDPRAFVEDGETPAASVPDAARLRRLVHTIRHRLHEDPRNAILWVDCALLYANLGQAGPAQRAMETALHVGATNRFVLRSAARLSIHLGSADRAHDLLVRSERTPHDPWLVAAEIATAAVAQRPARFLKIGRTFLAADKHPPFELSELASAIGTTELLAGANKRARKLFRASLAVPTENAVAQGRWASVRLPQFDEVLADHLTESSEARAWVHTAASEWKRALSECWQWREVEPFSSRPCVHGSYIASVALEDHDQAIRLAELGLAANPNDFTLHNNLVFALASSGLIVEARAQFERIIPSTDRERAVWNATRGLLEFRSGRRKEGRASYLEAIAHARRGDPRLLALAWLFLAREELLAGSPNRKETLMQAISSSEAPELAVSQEIRVLRDRVKQLSDEVKIAGRAANGHF